MYTCICICLRAYTAKLVHINNDCLFFPSFGSTRTSSMLASGDRHTLLPYICVLCTHKYTAHIIHTNRSTHIRISKRCYLLECCPHFGSALRPMCTHKSKRQMYYYCMRILYLYILNTICNVCVVVKLFSKIYAYWSTSFLIKYTCHIIPFHPFLSLSFSLCPRPHKIHKTGIVPPHYEYIWHIRVYYLSIRYA